MGRLNLIPVNGLVIGIKYGCTLGKGELGPVLGSRNVYGNTLQDIEERFLSTTSQGP